MTLANRRLGAPDDSFLTGGRPPIRTQQFGNILGDDDLFLAGAFPREGQIFTRMGDEILMLHLAQFEESFGLGIQHGSAAVSNRSGQTPHPKAS